MVRPQLSGFVCAYHPATPGLSPKHTIYPFSFKVFVQYLTCEKNENKQKEAGFGPLKKQAFTKISVVSIWAFPRKTILKLTQSSLFFLICKQTAFYRNNWRLRRDLYCWCRRWGRPLSWQWYYHSTTVVFKVWMSKWRTLLRQPW